MTSRRGQHDRNRDIQDLAERHLFDRLEHIEGGGSIVLVKGNDTEDAEAIVLTINGIGMHLPKGSDAEVILLSGGSDNTTKFAIMVTPHTKERQWKEGTNGQQKATDPNVALEFNAKRTHVTDENFAVGDGLFEVRDGKAYFRIPVEFAHPITAPVVNAGVTNTTVAPAPTIAPVPAFEST